MKNLILIAILCIVIPVHAQKEKRWSTEKGALSLGARTSYSLVNDGKWQKPAFGAGGQFRLRFSDRVNSEWFLDYLTADLADYGWRADTHIGWSMMYYLLRNPHPTVQPYILAGHCFEYLKFSANNQPSNFAERYSASAQAGIGTHFNITNKFDISLTAQYMIHFGTKIIASNAENVVTFTKVKGSGIHDHVLFNISLNYKIADLW